MNQMARVPALPEVASLRLGLARLEAQQQMLHNRHDQQVAAVALGKARATARPAVDELLEAQQAETHHQTVGAYSRMLTALVREVLHQDIEIGLDLYTDRGMPCLDIFALQDGGRIDIMEGCGGALTNVVCLGLRAIATVRSGLLRFMVLDEADCWIKPEMVPGFYRVLHQMAAPPLGFQILAISHHDVALVTGDGDPAMRGRSNLLTVTGRPEDPAGSQVVARVGAPSWPDDEMPGLRSIRLRGFAAFADAEFPLSPGVNALSGDNGIGKSRVLRFLRAVAYGDGNDGDIRFGARRAEGEVRLARGRVLHYSREPKRNPVNLWRLTEADGRIAEISGVRCEEGGRTPPSWVGLALGIARPDGLDLQLSHQKSPVFLLAELPSRRAVVLSAGGESGLLRDMIKLSKTDRSADTALVKSGEIEVAGLREHLARMPDIAELHDLLDQAAAASEVARLCLERLAEGEDDAARLQVLLDSRSQAERVVAGLADLPPTPDLHAAMAALREAQATGIQLASLMRRQGSAREVLAATAQLPEVPPAPPQVDPAEALIARIEVVTAARAAAVAVCTDLASLPDAAPTVPKIDDAEALAARISLAMGRRAEANAVLAALDNLPETVPVVPRLDPAEEAAARLQSLLSRRVAAEMDAAGSKAKELEAAMHISDLLSQVGNLCPLCGTPGINHEHVLRGEAA